MSGRRRRRGLLIALEGIDQSGKRTQSKLLAKKIHEFGYSVQVMSFPNYETVIGRCLKAYLNTKIRLNAYSVHLLYAANKWESAREIDRKIKRGTVLVLNRYRASNLAYGAAHGLPTRWLAALEEGLPKPNLVIILDVPPHISFRRKNQSRDLHERDRAFLLKVRNEYLRLAKKSGWRVIDAEGDRGTVHSAIWSITIPFLRKS